ncbi:hypothetical protein [Polynucleobacter asymbioticus]|uniref:hypothetical protein n=1 Tax=Polynucleobacter asymbioticus TaxID=576611 RepID=UPI0012379F2A|nr:hypothetical protein [Polynucleobacter asymbioticus]
MADVLFVAYDTKQMRISFLQAKSKVHTKPFPIWVANTEQFIVLSHRPTITRWLGAAVWNNDVLSKAILPSIGSFGTFTGVPGGSVDFTYSSADCLVPRGAPKAGGKYISGLFDLSYPPAIGRKDVSSFYERTYCPNMIDFGTAIFSLEIGSPISCLGSPLDSNVSALNARIALSRWASQESIRSPNDLILKGLLDSPHLIDLPSEQTNGHNLLGAKHVVVIKANA